MDCPDSRSKKWLKILLKDDSYIEEISQLIGHLCWKNVELSRKIGKVILRGCNKLRWEDLICPISCAQVYLTIEDEYQSTRIEWLLGMTTLKCKETMMMYNNRLQDIKTGCNQINKIEDMVFEYKSNLLKRSNEDCFLETIYSNRKDSYLDRPKAMMKGLLEACANKDKNSRVLTVLLTT